MLDVLGDARAVHENQIECLARNGRAHPLRKVRGIEVAERRWREGRQASDHPGRLRRRVDNTHVVARAVIAQPLAFPRFLLRARKRRHMHLVLTRQVADHVERPDLPPLFGGNGKRWQT